MFEQVCSNIKRFSEIGAFVDLKYIFLPGINDNEADIDGFIRFIDDILHFPGNHLRQVLLCRDDRMSPLSDQTFAMMARLTVAMETRCIPVKLYVMESLSVNEREIYCARIEELKTVDNSERGG